MIGRRLLHYEITEKLGDGGMGVVYKALDTHLDRFVAVKVLHEARLGDPVRKARFAQEAKAASALNHPNIINIHDIASDDGTDFIVMEYVAGKTLEALIPRRGLAVAETLKYAVQMADALAAAHAAGIVHRDLKPSNIMSTESGLIKVLDFGLAKLTEANDSLRPRHDTITREGLPPSQTSTLPSPHSVEGALLGTVAYMSPEQAEGRLVDARSDVFSFGIVLYEMLTGRRAFQGESSASTLGAILHTEPPPVDGLPRELERILMRCLRKDPARRFQTMADLSVALRELKEESDSGTLQRPVAAATGPAPVRGKRLLAAALTALLCAAAGGAAAWLYFHRQPAAEANMRIAPLPLLPGYVWNPSFSPDGRFVAFVWNGETQDNDDIYVQASSGEGTPYRLTRSPAAEFSPAWSPVESRVAFLRPSQPGMEIVVAPFPSGPERVVATTAIRFQYPSSLIRSVAGLSWAPDGKSVIVVDVQAPNPVPSLYRVSVDTGHKTLLTTPRQGIESDGMGVLSPDGRTLAFLRGSTMWTMDLYTQTMAGGPDGKPEGEPVRLTTDDFRIEGFDWSADGSSIVFSSNRLGGRRLWRVPSTGGEPTPLAVGGDNAYLPAVSRAGNRLAYSRLSSESTVWYVETDPANQREPKTLVQSPRKESQPGCGPGGRIAFRSERTGMEELYAADADGANAVLLTRGRGRYASLPVWSPDGRSIAYHVGAGPHGRWQVHALDASGGNLRRLSAENQNAVRCSWSRDGQWVYFIVVAGSEYRLHKSRADGQGAPVEVPVGNHQIAHAFESADGRWIYFTNWNQAGIWRVPVAGGTAEKVHDEGSPGLWALSPEGGFYLLKPEAARGPVIEYHQPGSARPAVIAQLKGRAVNYANRAGGLSLCPDGKRLYFTRYENTQGDIMLVEGFR